MRLFPVRRALCVLLVCVLLPCCASAQVFFDAPPTDNWYQSPLLRLTVFDTAQSDCMLLECGGESMMIDGGTASFRENLQNAIKEKGITQFKYLLNTHFHEDHISGLYWLMRYGFAAGAYLHPYDDRFATDISFRHRDTVAQAERSGIPVQQIFHGDELLLGEAVISLARYDEGDTTNARSVAARVQFGDASILLTADIIGRTQTWMAENMPPEWLDADILKAPHHGITAMVASFLDAVSPRVLFITNDYDRVDAGRTQAEKRSLPVFYTGEGRTVFETDGDDWYVYQTPGAF